MLIEITVFIPLTGEISVYCNSVSGLEKVEFTCTTAAKHFVLHIIGDSTLLGAMTFMSGLLWEAKAQGTQITHINRDKTSSALGVNMHRFHANPSTLIVGYKAKWRSICFSADGIFESRTDFIKAAVLGVWSCAREEIHVTCTSENYWKTPVA